MYLVKRETSERVNAVRIRNEMRFTNDASRSLDPSDSISARFELSYNLKLQA